MVVDTPVAPSLVGQSLLAAAVIRLFGFSHTALRLLTIALGAVGLWAVDRLLMHASCPAGIRFLALLLLALNPLYFYSSATFMTEIYGYVPALLAAVVWFHGRSRSSPRGPVVGLGVALAVGGMMGATVWVRQSCVVWLGALFGAGALRLILDRDWIRLRRSLFPLASGLLLGALVGGLYIPWARWTGNDKPEFSVPLIAMLSFDGRAWAVQSAVYLAYMSVFLAPLLLLLRPHAGWKRAAAWAAVMLIVSYLGSRLVAMENGPEIAMAAWLRRTFPYLHNIFFNAGIGPVTFAEAYGAESAVWPHWPGAIFRGLHACSILAAGLWALLLARIRSFVLTGRREAVEVFLFGALSAALSLLATIQAFQMKLFDRYHLPGVLGGTLAIGALLACERRSDDSGDRRWPRILRFGVPWLALSLFTVAGLHDHFRWNDARWSLVNEYLAKGRSTLFLQAGYEVNGWLNFEAITRGEKPPPGSGPCCYCYQPSWYCLDDSYWIGMAPPPGRDYARVKSIWPRYWLARGHPVSLYRRP